MSSFYGICNSIVRLDSNDTADLGLPLADIADALINALAAHPLVTKIANSVIHLQIYIDLVSSKHQALQAELSRFVGSQFSFVYAPRANDALLDSRRN